MKKIVASFLLLSVLAVPAMAFAQPNAIIDNLRQLVVVKKPIWVASGLIALIAFVVASILFFLAAGNSEKIAQAKTVFLWGIVGVVVGIVAYSIVVMIEIVLF